MELILPKSYADLVERKEDKEERKRKYKYDDDSDYVPKQSKISKSRHKKHRHYHSRKNKHGKNEQQVLRDEYEKSNRQKGASKGKKNVKLIGKKGVETVLDKGNNVDFIAVEVMDGNEISKKSNGASKGKKVVKACGKKRCEEVKEDVKYVVTKSGNKGDKKDYSSSKKASHPSAHSTSDMNASRGLFQVSTHGVLRKQEVSSDMSWVLKTTHELTAELDMKKYKNIVTPNYIKSEKHASNEAIKGLKNT